MQGKLFIGGIITEEEVAEIIKAHHDDEIAIRYYTALSSIHGIHDIVNLIFHDLSPISFARDYAIGKTIDSIISKIHSVVLNLKQKEKCVSKLTIFQEYQKKDGTIVFLNTHIDIEKYNEQSEQVTRLISQEFLENIEGGKTVHILFDLNNNPQITIRPK